MTTIGTFGFEAGDLAPDAGSILDLIRFYPYSYTSGDPADFPTLVDSTEQAYAGTHSAKMGWLALDNLPGAYTSFTAPAEPPTTVTFSAWVYVPTGSPDVVLSLGNSYTFGDPASAPVTAKDAWTFASVTAAYADLPNMSLYGWEEANVERYESTSTGTVYFDSVSISYSGGALPLPTPVYIDTTDGDWNIFTYIDVPKKVGSVDLRFEKVVVKGAASGTLNIDVAKGDQVYYASDSTGDYSINLRTSSSKTFKKGIRVGQTKTVTVVVQNGSTAHKLTDFKIDGTSYWTGSQKVLWTGSKKPTTGTASGDDAYIFQVCRTGASTYKINATWAPQK